IVRQHPERPPDQQRRVHGQEQPDGHHGPDGDLHGGGNHLADGAQFDGGSVAAALRVGFAADAAGRPGGDHAVFVSGKTHHKDTKSTKKDKEEQESKNQKSVAQALARLTLLFSLAFPLCSLCLCGESSRGETAWNHASRACSSPTTIRRASNCWKPTSAS